MVSIQMREVVHLVSSEASRLGDFLAGLDEQAWSQPSACEGWNISDVVGHLTAGAERWGDSITRAVSGDAAPPAGQAFLTGGDRGSQAIAQEAISSRQRMGPDLMESYTAGYDRLGQVLSRLAAEDWDKPCYHRRGPLTVGEYVALRIQELAVHGWDIRWGLDESAELWEEPLPLLVGRVPRWLTHAFRPGLELPTPVRYRFDVSGPVPVREDVLVIGDSYQVGPHQEGHADVTFRCDTGNYILLIYGRLNVDRATAGGRLTTEGQRELASNFTAWFQGF